jgi:catecholate siderophore receptor
MTKHQQKNSNAAPLVAAHSKARSVGTTLGLLPTIALSTAFAMPAHAQTATDVTDIGTILVETATETQGYLSTESSSEKSTTSIQNTAKTIDVTTETEIEERAVTSLDDVLRTTPGVTLSAGEGGNPLGTNANIRGYDASSSVTIDGLRNASRTTTEVFNLSSVEVVKGSDSTTAGRGSTGGAINLSTKTPQDVDFFDTSVTVGTGGYARATADYNKTIENGAFRLNVMTQTADSLNGRKNLESERFGFAPSLRYDFNGTTSLTTGLYLYKSNDLPDYGVTMTTEDNVGSGYGVGSGTVDDPYLPTSVDASTWYGVTDRDYREVESAYAYARIDHQFANGLDWATTLRASVDSNEYVTTAPDGEATYVDASSKDYSTKTEAVTFNSQVSGMHSTGKIDHSFAFGIDASKETNYRRDIDVDGDDVFFSYDDPDNDIDWSGDIIVSDSYLSGFTKSVALYAFDTMTLSPEWEISAGLRYDYHEATSVEDDGDIVNKSNFWNGSLGAVYHPIEDLSVYASVATSSNPTSENAGIGRSSTDSASLDPERSVSLEVGTKWLVNDALLLTAAYYRTEKTNERISSVDDEETLAGNSRSKGIELGASGDINEKWSIASAYTYTDYKLKDGGYSCRRGVCTEADDFITNQPAHQLAIWTTYDVTGQLKVGGGASYIGERFLSTDMTSKLPATWQIDAMASYEFNDSTSVQLNVTNLFDETIYASGRSGDFVNVGPARTVYLGLNKSF